MKEKYKEICQFLNIGYWQIDLIKKNIQLDYYLQEQLRFSHSKIGINDFLNSIIPDEREIVKSAIYQCPRQEVRNLFFCIHTGEEYCLLEAVINPHQATSSFISEGYIKIVDKNSAHYLQKEVLQKDHHTEYIWSTDNNTTDRELYLRLSLACQTALIYPFTWDFNNNRMDFTIFDKEDIVNKQISLSEFTEFIHPDDQTIALPELQLFSEKKINSFKFRFRSSYFESNRWFEISTGIYEPSPTNQAKAIGILQDVTDQMEVQATEGRNKQLLLEAQQQIKSAIADRNLALDNLNTALIYMNSDFVVQWNSMKTMKNILGENAYAIGEPCYKSTFQRDVPCEDCPVLKLFQSKKTEMHRVHRNGEILEVMANPVYNENQELIGGVLKLDVISERVKQENLINELNTLMDAILNHIPVNLYVKDPNNSFKYLYWNKALAESMRLPASKVIGHTDEEISLNKKAVQTFREHDLELLQSRGKMYSIEEYEGNDGDLKIVSSLKTLIPAPNGKLPWILGISWDITELKRNEKELILAKEKAEESNRLKSAFLANMSHEIRTPLNAIVGFSDLLSETDDKTERMEYVEIIKSNNELLLQLISDILDLAKIEAQTLDFVYETVNAYDLTSQIVAAGNLRKEAKVPVILDKYEPDCYLYTDKNRVNQVLSNFIGNALKFTSEGNVKVGYYCTGKGTVKFYVHDTGTGIDAKHLDSVFERFVKLDNFKQGTGLGLSICKSIIKELKGSIGVESEPGNGSCFWFTLPVYMPEGKESGEESDNSQQQKRVVATIQVKNQMDTKPTILVAEDLDSNYQFVDRSLRNSYNLVRAHNGKEAIDLYNKLKPDIILMDMQMPEMNGLEATREIRQKDQEIPIIAFSAYSFNTTATKAKNAGCDDFIAKPISVNHLREKVNSYIRFIY